MKLGLLDIIIFFLYCLIIIGTGLWISRDKKGVKKKSGDYFLAGRTLPWWAVGASIIASNISAEQFIGMSGSGFAIGLGIASYEFLAALGLVIVAAYFLPVYINKGVFTMPQFLEQRYDKTVKTTMAVFWLAVFIFVNLTSVLYLGALAVKNMMGVDMGWAILGLALFAAAYSVKGGLKSVALTDVIQVVFLIAGGLVTTFVAFRLLGDGSFSTGVSELWSEVGKGSADNRFHMVLDRESPAYMDLPGIWVLIGGLWVANLYYWGCNQYIIQRALAAKSLDQAQKGLVFAGFIKLLLPFIVVIPGIIAYVLVARGRLEGLNVADDAYPVLLSQIPAGIKGVSFAAIVAAIVSSLASMMNSISTIFTMDIYKEYIRPQSSEYRLVTVGKITCLVSLLIASFIAPLLGNLDQAFQFIQEFTGFVSPGALAIFLAGFFYRKATSAGALAAAVSTFVFSLLFKFAFPAMPFLNRMGIVFLLCGAVLAVVSAMDKNGKGKPFDFPPGLFRTSLQFKIWTAVIIAVLVLIYGIWW